MTGQLSLLDAPLLDAPPRPPAADRPLPAHRGGRDTERRAAELARPRAGTARARVLAAIAAAGDRGATDFELGERLGMFRWVAGTRRGELERDGWVEATDERRPTDTGTPAIVWRLTARGREALGR